MRLDHGEHNESLSDLLLDNGSFNDWVVTAAFYACIHFVEHKLFPCKIDGNEYQQFNDYYDYEVNVNHKSTTKHALKTVLVNKRLPGVCSQYRWLKEACMNSRYSDYKVSDSKAKSCNSAMKAIKAACV